MSTTIITQFSQNDSASTDTQENTNRTLTAIIQDDVNIFVNNPITHNEGKLKFTDYEIKVKSSSILVKKMNLDITKPPVRRRYNDFCWLYNELNNLRINLPELPNKQLKVTAIPGFRKYFNKNFETQFIEKRSVELEKFLNKLSINPLVQNHRSFYQFLQDDNLNK